MKGHYTGQIYNGFPVHVSDHAGAMTQFRFPRSKKKRIRKKWAKDRSNQRLEPGMIKIHDAIIVHPAIWERLKIEIERQAQLRTGWEDHYRQGHIGGGQLGHI